MNDRGVAAIAVLDATGYGVGCESHGNRLGGPVGVWTGLRFGCRLGLLFPGAARGGRGATIGARKAPYFFEAKIAAFNQNFTICWREFCEVKGEFLRGFMELAFGVGYSGFRGNHWGNFGYGLRWWFRSKGMGDGVAGVSLGAGLTIAIAALEVSMGQWG